MYLLQLKALGAHKLLLVAAVLVLKTLNSSLKGRAPSTAAKIPVWRMPCFTAALITAYFAISLNSFSNPSNCSPSLAQRLLESTYPYAKHGSVTCLKTPKGIIKVNQTKFKVVFPDLPIRNEIMYLKYRKVRGRWGRIKESAFISSQRTKSRLKCFYPRL